VSSPYSLLTRLRVRLARRIEPYPDAGEAWCMDCALNGGRTLIVPSSGHREHVELHRGKSSDRTAHGIVMRVNYGPRGGGPVIPLSAGRA
jgi:hypothetical protein